MNCPTVRIRFDYIFYFVGNRCYNNNITLEGKHYCHYLYLSDVICKQHTILLKCLLFKNHVPALFKGNF